MLYSLGGASQYINNSHFIPRQRFRNFYPNEKRKTKNSFRGSRSRDATSVSFTSILVSSTRQKGISFFLYRSQLRGTVWAVCAGVAPRQEIV
jgi:hypothetical protein